jgi:hypothetical protein
MKKIILLLLLFGFAGCVGDLDISKCHKICEKVGMRVDSTSDTKRFDKSGCKIIKCTCKTWYEHEND